MKRATDEEDHEDEGASSSTPLFNRESLHPWPSSSVVLFIPVRKSVILSTYD
jgi:hypothetical protein